MNIQYASLNHIDEISRLFDLYRQYYQCEPDPSLARAFIKSRIENNESDIFVALDGDKAGGFVQLYPSFCSIDAGRIYILHDLYVDSDQRKKGIGRSLMERSTAWAKENGAVRLDLLTEHSNKAGQHLYESLGYKKMLEDYYAYSLGVS